MQYAGAKRPVDDIRRRSVGSAFRTGNGLHLRSADPHCRRTGRNRKRPHSTGSCVLAVSAVLSHGGSPNGTDTCTMTDATAPFGITVCGIDELAGHCSAGASHVLSILDPESPVPEAFGAFGEHKKLELRFDDIIEETPGRLAPQSEHVALILAFGRDLGAEPRSDAHLLVHCHAGISRSTAAMALLLAQALPDQPSDAILARVHGIREKAWPNLRLIEIGDAVLGRKGSLIDASHALYRLQLERRPHLASFMEEAGRGREVVAAHRHSA